MVTFTGGPAPSISSTSLIWLSAAGEFGLRVPEDPCCAPTIHSSLQKAGRPITPVRALYSVAGGPSGIRTHDLLNAIETRSQTAPWALARAGPNVLGQAPKLWGKHPKCWGKPRSSGASPEALGQVDLAGLEPATSSVRLMRAPNCATGPRLGLRIVLRSRNRCQECRLKPRSLELDRRADNFLTPPLAGHRISPGNARTIRVPL